MFLVTVGAILQGQFIIASLFGIWFSFMVSAIWLVPIAFLIDGYFGAFHEVPVLTVVAILLFIVTELAQRHIAWHTEETL